MNLWVLVHRGTTVQFVFASIFSIFQCWDSIWPNCVCGCVAMTSNITGTTQHMSKILQAFRVMNMYVWMCDYMSVHNMWAQIAVKAYVLMGFKTTLHNILVCPFLHIHSIITSKQNNHIREYVHITEVPIAVLNVHVFKWADKIWTGTPAKLQTEFLMQQPAQVYSKYMWHL